MKRITGGVTAAKGFEAAAAAAGIKYENRTDMALVYSISSELNVVLMSMYLSLST